MMRRSWTEYNRGGCNPTDSHIHTRDVIGVVQVFSFVGLFIIIF